MWALRCFRHLPAWSIWLAILAACLGAAWTSAVAPLAQECVRQFPLSQSSCPGLHRDWLDEAYRTLTMLTFGADWTLPHPETGAAVAPFPIGWELQFARFLLPVVAIGGLLVVAIRRFGHAMQRRLMPRTDHTVLCGLGEAGLAYVQGLERWRDFREHGPIVVIEWDPANPNIPLCRKLGIPVIEGNALSEDGSALDRAGCIRARRVIGLMRADKDNVELTLRVQRLLQRDVPAPRQTQPAQAGSTPKHGHGHHVNKNLVMIAQVNEPLLARRLEYYEKISHATRFDVRFNNINALIAQQLLIRYPPDFYADLFPVPAPRLVIYGFGRLGQQVFTEAVRLCQFRPDQPPRFTIVDRDTQKVRRILAQEYPHIEGRDGAAPPAAARIKVCAPMDFTPATITKEKLDSILREDDCPATQHIVCLGDEEKSLSLALSLRDLLLERENANAPIFVRARRSGGMAALLDSHRGRPEVPDGLFPFGTLERVLNHRVLDDQWIEHVAQALHYCSYYLYQTPGPHGLPAAAPWNRLEDVHRRANRRAAIHIDVKLRAVNLRRFPAAKPGDPKDAADVFEKDASLLAEMEHRRYVASKLADGWRFAEERTDALRRHNVLKAYDHIPEADRAKNRRQVGIVPGILTPSGKQVGDIVAKELESNWTEERDKQGDQAEPGEDVASEEQFEKQRTQARDNVASVLKELEPYPQAVRRVRRIGIIGPRQAAHLNEDQTARIDQCLDLWGGNDGNWQKGLEHDAITVISPLLHSAERHTARWIVEKCRGNPPRGDSPGLLPAGRLDVLCLLPLPYDFLQGSGKYFAADEDGNTDEDENDFRTLIGESHVRYVEMPLRNGPGLSLGARDRGDDKQGNDRRQRQRTGQSDLVCAYIIERCDHVILIRTENDGLAGC